MSKLNYFKRSKIYLALTMLIVLSGIAVGQILAQVTLPPFLSVNAGTLVYEDENGVVTELASATNIVDMVWSDDGQQIGFILFDRDPRDMPILELGIADLSEQPIETLILQTRRLTWGYGISWTHDGRLLFIAENPTPNPTTGSYDKLDIFAVRFDEAPELLGTFTIQDGCGGGSSLPTDWRYSQEIGGLGMFLTLAETQHGILYSTICTGTNLALLDPETGNSVSFATNLTNAVVSPDGNYVAGIQIDYSVEPALSELAVYDLATGDFEIIPTTDEPDLVFWGQDGIGLYYTTRIVDANLVETLSDEDLALLTEQIGYELDNIPTYQSSLYYVSLDSGETTVAYAADVAAITRVFEFADALYVSRVPNPESWLAQIIAGNIDYDDEAANLEAVQAEVFRVERSGMIFGEASFLGWYDQFTPYVTR